MANNYDKILELANANNMGLSNTIKRDFGIPLDYTSIQKDYLEAVKYAATNTLAYIGQPISVEDKLYIVTETSQGKYPAEVGDGETQYDVYLAEVGSATEGDGATIDLKDGVLSLHGIDGKLTGTYVPSLVDGVLTWNAPDNTTVDGLTASVDALNLKVFGKEADDEAGTEAVEGLVDTVAANTQAIVDNASDIADNAAAIENITKAETGAIATAVAAEASARDTAIDTAFTTKVGSITEGKTVVGMISDVESKIPTNNNQLENGAGYQTASDVSTAIANKADKATTLAGYGITDAYTKEEVNSAIAGITHFTTKVVTSTDEVTESGVLYLIKSKDIEGKDNYDEYLYIEGLGATLIGDTSTDLSDYVTNSALTTALAPYAKTADVVAKSDFEIFKTENTQAISDARTGAVADVAAVGYALEESVASRLADKADKTALNDYYTSDEIDAKGYAVAETVNAELAKKVETAQLTHTTEGVGEGITKVGTQLNIVVDAYRKSEVYTKSETDNQIDAKIASVTGGESAADVKLALESYRDAVNTEVWGAKAAEWTKRETDEEGKVTVTYTPQYGTTSRVDTLEADVATLKTNVQKAQDDATAAGTAVSTLENGKVANNTSRIAAVENQITGEDGLSARIGALEAYDTQHKTDYANLKGKVDTAVDTTIPALSTKVSNNETAIASINTTLNGAEGTDGLIATVSKKANAADVYTKGEVDGFVSTINTEIGKKADAATTYSKTEVDTAISTAIGNIDNTAITNNSADIAVLVGDDKNSETGRANKSIRAIAAEEVAKIVDGAPEALDTLAEIADWITDDNTGSAAVIEDIAKHTAILAGFGTAEGEVATVKEYVDDSIAAIPQFTLEVATAENLGGVKSSSGDNKVSVAADGVMSVSAVNVNTLTQTAGDVLILNGGSAAN